MPLILTDVIAWAWEHEADLPQDRTRLLKRLAWMIAQRMYDRAMSSCHDLHSELSGRCGGERGRVALNVHSLSLQKQHPLPKQGWYLEAIRHFECTDHRTSVKCDYVYACRNYPSKRHGLTISQINAQTDRCCEFAHFAIAGVEFYWWSTPKVRVLLLDCDWSLYIDPHNDHRLPTQNYHIVEMATFNSGAVTWIRYDRTTTTAIVEATFTNSMQVNWVTRRYGEAGNTDPFQMAWVPFSRGGAATQVSCFVDYNHHIQDGSFFARYEYVDAHLAMLVAPTRVFHVKLFPHLSKLLSRQLRDRMYGIARKLLLVKAQWKEEALAADPVKKCAACAVQAAKDQLVLGLEPPSKRVCM